MKKYISAKETAFILGVKTSTLRMWRWRESGFALFGRKKDNGHWEYDEEWVNIFKNEFNPVRQGSKQHWHPKGTTIDKTGIRIKGHKRYCNCLYCVNLRPKNSQNSDNQSITSLSAASRPSEKKQSVTANKHEDLLNDPGYMNRLGKYNEKRKQEKLQKEQQEEQKKEFEQLKIREAKAVGRQSSAIRNEKSYIRWLGPKDMTPTWRPIHEPIKNKNKFSYY